MAKKRGRKKTSWKRGARGILGGSGKLGPIVQGVAAGLAEQLGSRFIPGYGDEIGLGVAYWFTGNQTLGTILGLRVSQLVPLGAVGFGPSGAGGAVGGYA